MNRNKRVILLVVIALLMIVALSIRDKGYFKASYIRGDLEIVQLNEIDNYSNQGSKILKFNNGIIKYTENNLYNYNYLGEENWNVLLNINSPQIKVNYENIYLFDEERNQIIKVDNNGNIVYRYTLEGKMISFIPGKSDNIVLIYEKLNEGAEIISIIEKNGRKKDTINIVDGHILSMTHSVERDIIALGILDTSGEQLSSHILQYNFRGNLLNSVNLENRIICNMHLDRKGKFIIVSDSNVFDLTGDSSRWTIELEEVKADKIINDGIAVRGLKNRNRGAQGENIILIKNNGKVIEVDSLTEQIIGMDSYNEDLLTYSKRSMFIIDGNGNLVFKHRYHMDIEEVYLFEKGYLITVTKENVYFNKLEKK